MLSGMLELLYWRNAWKRAPSLPSDEVVFSTNVDVELYFFNQEARGIEQRWSGRVLM